MRVYEGALRSGNEYIRSTVVQHIQRQEIRNSTEGPRGFEFERSAGDGDAALLSLSLSLTPRFPHSVSVFVSVMGCLCSCALRPSSLQLLLVGLMGTQQEEKRQGNRDDK